MTHFMKPHFLDVGQKAALDGSLGRLEIGDEKSRRIFIIALDYELTEYDKKRSSGAAGQVAPKVDDSLEKISEAASALSSMLQQLPGDSFEHLSQKLSDSDTYARQYSGDYLDALQNEIRRVSSACQNSVVNGDGTGPGRGEAALVKAVANAYRECFEMEPLIGEENFIPLLEEISALCEINLPTDEDWLRPLMV